MTGVSLRVDGEILYKFPRHFRMGPLAYFTLAKDVGAFRAFYKVEPNGYGVQLSKPLGFFTGLSAHVSFSVLDVNLILAGSFSG